MVDEKLLSLYGKELGLDSTDQVKEIIDAFKNDLITESMFKEEILPEVKCSEEEIDSIVVQKSLDLEIRWLFSNQENEIIQFYNELKSGVGFDTLFIRQIDDSTFHDMRFMKLSRYDLGKKNSLLASVIDTLQIGKYSIPIKTDDGWYIVNLNNILHNIIQAESESQRLRKEAVAAITKKKADRLSNSFIENLYNSSQPIVHKNIFNIALGHTANFVLAKELYKEWGISNLLQESISEIGSVGKEDIGKLRLVTLKNDAITLNEFMIWFRTRFQNIKFDKSSLNKYGYSLYSIVQRMIRDRLLIKRAYEKDYQHSPSIDAEMKNWKSKILFSSVRNELMNSIFINNAEQNYNSAPEDENASEELNSEFTIKLYRLLTELRSKYKISINKELLRDIKVSSENDPQAIDLYAVKKGGLIPRTPYPTIDNDWQYWQ